MDLFVLGAGELGLRIATLWRSQFPGAALVCETLTTVRHPAIEAIGATPRRRDEALSRRYPSILVAIPPSKTFDYVAEVERAVGIWEGTGTLLLISSTGVLGEESGGWVDERSPVGPSDRSQLLKAAEEKVRDKGGSVLRLAGLYSSEKGPHAVYRRNETSSLNGEGWINLIHYDDAATLAVAILRGGHSGEFLGCDDEPMKRRDFVALLKPGKEFLFTGAEPGLGKRCRNLSTRAQTGWSPKWKTFSHWLSQNPSSLRAVAKQSSL